MTDLLVNTGYDWDFDGPNKFKFYTTAPDRYPFTDGAYSELFFVNGSLTANIVGSNFTFKGSGSNTTLVSGTVKALFFDQDTNQFLVSNANVDAAKLAPLLAKPSALSSAKIWALFLAGDDEISLGQGSDTINGFGGDDTIRGRAGNDTIDAGIGDDIVFGGTGKDILTGGKGADIFVFDVKVSAENADVITDFNIKEDILSLDHHFFRKLSINADPDEGWFLVNTTDVAKDTGDRLIYNSKTGDLSYDFDGSGKGKAIVFAELDAGLKLTADHFDIF